VFADIDTASPEWQAFTARTSDFVAVSRMEFSASDRRNASWCWLRGGKHSGYAVDGFWEVCFDHPSQCRTCGLGARQIMPMRLEKAPKLADGVVQELLNLTATLFANERTYEDTFAKYGVSALPVHDRKGRTINGIVQLAMPSFDPGRIDHRVEICSACGRQKYWTETEGFFPRLETYPEAACGTSIRPFGGGAGLSVWYPSFVGGALKDNLIAKKVKCFLWPVAA